MIHCVLGHLFDLFLYVSYRNPLFLCQIHQQAQTGPSHRASVLTEQEGARLWIGRNKQEEGVSDNFYQLAPR